jgi:heme/copper-type cytochrome/quinol oxidase subunit 1
MDWKMISAMGQMLGAIGVIIWIIYLGAQIRIQNEKSWRHRHTDEYCALIDRHTKTAKPTIYDGYT